VSKGISNCDRRLTSEETQKVGIPRTQILLEGDIFLRREGNGGMFFSKIGGEGKRGLAVEV